MFEPLLMTHWSLTLLMTGIIWFVQIVHYPLFRTIPPASFVRYEREHVRRTGWIVAPTMLLELLTGCLLVLFWWQRPETSRLVAAMGLLGIIWLSTFLIQVPLHGRLSRAFDQEAVDRLARSNWIRTSAWSLRVLILLPTVLEQLT